MTDSKTVTSDEILKRLDEIADAAEFNGFRGDAKTLEKAAARIRELEAELAFYKGFHDGVCKDGTHVVVPVEPTQEMLDAALACLHAPTIYRAMIRAAQEKAD